MHSTSVVLVKRNVWRTDRAASGIMFLAAVSLGAALEGVGPRPFPRICVLFRGNRRTDHKDCNSPASCGLCLLTGGPQPCPQAKLKGSESACPVVPKSHLIPTFAEVAAFASRTVPCKDYRESLCGGKNRAALFSPSRSFRDQSRPRWTSPI